MEGREGEAGNSMRFIKKIIGWLMILSFATLLIISISFYKEIPIFEVIKVVVGGVVASILLMWGIVLIIE